MDASEATPVDISLDRTRASLRCPPARALTPEDVADAKVLLRPEGVQKLICRAANRFRTARRSLGRVVGPEYADWRTAGVPQSEVAATGKAVASQVVGGWLCQKRLA